MRKNELLHLHALLELVRRHATARGWVDDEAFAAYDELDVSPRHAHRSKGYHEDAVEHLSRLLADHLSAYGKYRDEREVSPDAATADANH